MTIDRFEANDVDLLRRGEGYHVDSVAFLLEHFIGTPFVRGAKAYRHEWGPHVTHRLLRWRDRPAGPLGGTPRRRRA